ncbi:Integral membrane protein OS=Streptomyces tendae OX=1932 GN=F3L20_03900 PE=4 SV=1 [Streptomyces tendae]
MRLDPMDPAQRRARYALLGGLWAFFFALFNWPYLALLLGALALYWSISALRAKPRGQDPDTPAPEQKGRPQTTAAVSGMVMAGLALLLVAGAFGARLIYSDYYECTSDALTQQARQSCGDHLPEQLRGVLGEEG